MSTNFKFPQTGASIISKFYFELSLKPNNISRHEHVATVFDTYFDRSFYQMGGIDNKTINFQEFKDFLISTFTKIPNLNVVAEDLIASGDKVTVKVKLFDTEAGVEINYLTSYHVENGKIMSRYAYSDGGF